jgi:hypothetical protein
MGPNCPTIWAARFWKRGSVSESTPHSCSAHFFVDVCWSRISTTGVTIQRKLLNYGYNSVVCSVTIRSPSEGMYGGYEATMIVAIIKLCHHIACVYTWINRFTDTSGTIRINQLQTWKNLDRPRFVLLGCELHHSAICFLLLYICYPSVEKKYMLTQKLCSP